MKMINRAHSKCWIYPWPLVISYSLGIVTLRDISTFSSLEIWARFLKKGDKSSVRSLFFPRTMIHVHNLLPTTHNMGWGPRLKFFNNTQGPRVCEGGHSSVTSLVHIVLFFFPHPLQLWQTLIFFPAIEKFYYTRND